MFIDESGLRLLSALVRSYAPCGQTPILHAFCSRAHLSIMAGLTLTGSFYTLVRRRALTSADSVCFLKALRRHLRSKVMVIWDSSPIHKREVCSFLSGEAGSDFLIEPLPPYAPELNPLDAGLWHQLKDVELRNRCCPNLTILTEHLRRAILRLRRKPGLVESCVRAAGLSL